MSIAGRIKEIKNKSGMTSEELSGKSGIPSGTLNKILSGSTQSLKAETLVSLAKALNVSVGELIGENQDKKNTCDADEKNYGYVRAGAFTPETKVGDVNGNIKAILSSIAKADKQGVKLTVLPELCITGYTCSDLFFQTVLIEKAEDALCIIAEKTKNYGMLVFVGCPLRKNGKLYNCAAALYKGDILGIVPKSYLPNYNEFYEKRQFNPAPIENGEIIIKNKTYPFGTKMIFTDSEMKEFRVACEICEDLWVMCPPSLYHSAAGASITVNLSASDEIIGKAEYRRNLVATHSAKTVSGYVYASAGGGESSTDVVYSGHNIISENGNVLAESKLFSGESAVADIDCSFIEFERTKTVNYDFGKLGEYKYITFALPIKNEKISRKYFPTPFVPSAESERTERIDLILTIQAEGLKRRITHINCKTLVIGVSGGLDSTLAALVAVKTLDMLNRPHSDLIAVTMPCFGTTGRTKSNSIKLAEALRATVKEIDITEAVRTHFRDIGQKANVTDVTYENSQARERTQVLMDIANKEGGIVVGTGDLSELALGWATYNGDHMSMYGVNNSIPKTLVKYMIKHIAEKSDENLKAILYDILDTPVSPELIPAENGRIIQKTEDIVGPYLLHDFFLYYLVRMGFRPSKVFEIAKESFKGQFSEDDIFKWLETFIKRFFAQQFKRSCLPDGVKVGTVSLSPRGDWRMPSDADRGIWLEDLENAK